MEISDRSPSAGRAPGAVTVDEAGVQRGWRAGKLPPMPIRKLPEAPQAAHIIGPAMILVALGVGLGETFLWPRLVIVFGPNIRWLFLVGVAVQTVVMLEMARYAMATVESILAFLVGVLVIGSAIVAAIVGSLSDLADVLVGLVRFDFGIPHAAVTAAWFPIIVGSIAFAGPSGMQQMWYTLWLRDKGAGMGVHMPRVRGLLHAGEEETVPDSGSMFDVDDPDEWRKWQEWRKWVRYDALLLFFGITMLVTIIFTVMAMHAADVSGEARNQLINGERDQALIAMRDAFADKATILGTLFFCFISLVGWKASVGLFDAFARGQSDMTYYFMPDR